MSLGGLRPGQRIDRYELLRSIAEGGMGSIWLARLSGRHGFQRLCAFKAILPKYSNQPTFRAMFLDEARIAALLDHPNVAQIFDFGEQEGLLYLIMEYVDGPSLRALWHRAIELERPLPLNFILRIMADACAGLHAAHELVDDKGVPLELVHRDMSPHNILVGRNGAVKVIDFGVAKAANRLATDTQGGAIKGKVEYASPEQVIGARLDRRSDVFSVGATLYELIANRPPFDAPCELAILTRLTGGDSPTPLPPHVPDPIRELVSRCLARRPADRPPDADAVRRALEELMLQLPLRVDRLVIGETVRELFGRDLDRRACGLAGPEARSPQLCTRTLRSEKWRGRRKRWSAASAGYVLAGTLGAALTGTVAFTRHPTGPDRARSPAAIGIASTALSSQVPGDVDQALPLPTVTVPVESAFPEGLAPAYGCGVPGLDSPHAEPDSSAAASVQGVPDVEKRRSAVGRLPFKATNGSNPPQTALSPVNQSGQFQSRALPPYTRSQFDSSAAAHSGAPAASAPAIGGPAASAPAIGGRAASAPVVVGPAASAPAIGGPAASAPAIGGPAAPAIGGPAASSSRHIPPPSYLDKVLDVSH